MFLSLSKTFAKVGGTRFCFGMRMTKKNAAYMWIVLLLVSMLQLTWYMLILCFWLMYAMCYGIYWCIKQLCRALKK